MLKNGTFCTKILCSISSMHNSDYYSAQIHPVSHLRVRNIIAFCPVTFQLLQYCWCHLTSQFEENLEFFIFFISGLGFKKAEFIHYSKCDVAVQAMHQIKKVFDPLGIMNPYKVLPNQWYFLEFIIKVYFWSKIWYQTPCSTSMNFEMDFSNPIWFCKVSSYVCSYKTVNKSMH